MVYSPALFRALRGVFCVYKPNSVGMRGVISEIQHILASDLNSCKCRPVKQRVVFHEDDPSSLPTVTAVPDLSDDPLVIGPRYMPDDFRVTFVDALGHHSSGVTVMLVNEDWALKRIISAARYMRTYHLTGKMGTATLDSTAQSRVLRRATYDHVSLDKVDRILAKMQSGHQRYMFEAAGIQMDSQEAYEMAVQGFFRPIAKNSGQVVYSMKCIEFQPPFFTIEVHCINENTESLANLIHNLGAQLKCLSHCVTLRRVRYGRFLLGHALHRNEWTAENIIANIRKCKSFITIDKVLESPGIKQIQQEEMAEEQKHLSEGNRLLGS